MPVELGPWAPRYALLAGASDGLTGLALLALPATTTSWMGLSAEPSQLVLLRFIGAFVLGVGLSYLYPLAIDRESTGERLWIVFEVTALVRFSVAAFVYAALALGWLEVGWVLVANSDLFLALLQVLWVKRSSRAAA